MSSHPPIIEKDGRKEFVVLPDDGFLQMQAEIEEYEDPRTLREEKAIAHAQPTRSLYDILKKIGSCIAFATAPPPVFMPNVCCFGLAPMQDTTFEYYNTTSGALTGISGTQGSFSFNGSTLTWSPIPEPSSTLAGLLITAGLLRRRRAV